MFLLKRLFDLVISSLLLVVLSPLLCIIAVAVAVTMGRPVLFRQERPGLRRKPFYIIKFRTMSECRDERGELLPDCERETTLGKVLRNWSIDELPQLINVVRGEMSLVGPRPMLTKYLVECGQEHMRRFDVRPGITGLAQVNGRKALDYATRFKLDVQYVENYSLWLDLKILCETPITVLRRYGCQEIEEVVDSMGPMDLDALEASSVLMESDTALVGTKEKSSGSELVDAKRK